MGFRAIGEAEIRRQAAQAMIDLFDSMYEGAFAVDTRGRISWMNDKFKALLGWNGVDPVEGKPVEDVIPHSEMRRVLDSGRADLLDIIDLGNRQLTVSRIPLRGEDGRLLGAIGVILFDRLQSLKPLVNRFQQLQSELETTRRELAESRRAKYRFGSFVGATDAVRQLKRHARRAAERDAAVLLYGETGTGKELLAHAIHATSPRAQRPMVRVNVAAIPETLLESELFGAAPGAYTGVGRQGREGKILLADGGTLFLDEIGDMPPPLQAKLLRVLQEQEIEPLGANRVIAVDVRIISATSRDLKAMVDRGEFRADLYYRLNVLPVTVPPLRERLNDLPLLCETLLEDMAHRAGGAPRDVAADAFHRLAAHNWPGNVRELRNVLEQAAAAVDTDVLGPDDFDGLLPRPRSAAQQVSTKPAGEIRPMREVLAEAEDAAIRHALEQTNGVKAEAARRLGISRAQFYAKLASHGIMSETSDRRKAV